MRDLNRIKEIRDKNYFNLPSEDQKLLSEYGLKYDQRGKEYSSDHPMEVYNYQPNFSFHQLMTDLKMFLDNLHYLFLDVIPHLFELVKKSFILGILFVVGYGIWYLIGRF